MDKENSISTISEGVLNYLKRKPLLGLVNLGDFYRAVSTNDSGRKIAYNLLRRLSVGAVSSNNSPPETYYAIYLPLEIGSDKVEDLYFSLPGIPRDVLMLEDPNSKIVSTLKERLSTQYGKSTVEYWLDAAQDRTVEIAQKAMKAARERDKGRCILCMAVKHLQKLNQLPVSRNRKVNLRSSHIISRKSIFWHEVEGIYEQYNLFCDEGTDELRHRLSQNPFLCAPNYIVQLCIEHDRLVVQTIRKFSEGHR